MKIIAALVYLAVMGVYFHVLWKEDIWVSEPAAWGVLAFLAAVHVAAGLTIGLWAVLLPFAAVLVAVPAGYGEGAGQEAPIWFYYAFIMSIPAAGLVALGIGARWLLSHER